MDIDDAAPNPTIPPGYADALTDAELWRVLMLGVAVGTPAVFVLTTLLALPVAGLVNALGVATVPAFFCGMFYGGLVPLMRRLARVEAADRRPVGARAAAAAPVAGRPRARPAWPSPGGLVPPR